MLKLTEHIPDLLHFLGLAAVIFGVSRLSHAAAWIVAGVAALIYSFLLSSGRSLLKSGAYQRWQKDKEQ